MTRYYYTDPISSAWMAKEHEFVFDIEWIVGTPCKHTIRINNVGWEKHTYRKDFLTILTQYNFWLSSGKFYIAPESLHLLEPIKGDMDDCGWRYDGNGCWNGNDDHDFSGGEHVIIQRNNMAFHWPQQEAE